MHNSIKLLSSIFLLTLLLYSCTDSFEEELSQEVEIENFNSNISTQKSVESFSVFAWNVQFLNVNIPIFNAIVDPISPANSNHVFRHVKDVQSSVPNGMYDVLVFNEAFLDNWTNGLRHALSRNGYTSSSGPHKISRSVNSGVMVMSPHKVLSTTFNKFNHCYGHLGNGSDCLADKGFLHVKLEKNGKNYNIIATHLDAGDKNGDRVARARQINQIQSYINTSWRIKEGEPVIISCDLNTIGNSNHPNYNNSDFRNMLNSLDSETSYELADVPFGTTAGFDDSEEKLLDYILLSDLSPRPTNVTYQVHSNSLDPVVLPNGYIVAQGSAQISDHRPVESIFTFDFNAEDPSAEITSCNSFVSNGARYWRCSHNGAPGRYEWKLGGYFSFGTGTSSKYFLCTSSSDIELWDLSTNRVVDTWDTCN